MFETAKKQALNLVVTGIAAAAFVTGTVACAQGAPAPEPKFERRYVTDPAELEAILAACGLSGKAKPAKAAEIPPATAETSGKGEAPKKKIRCSIGGAPNAHEPGNGK